MNLSVVSGLIVFFLVASAQAGIYLEPYAGYETGTEKGTIIFSGTDLVNNYETAGTGFGGKLGISFLWFSAGVDYYTNTLEEDSKIAGEETVDSDTTDLGAFVSFKFAFIKLSASYFFDSEIDNKFATGEGGGTKIGVGFSLLPFVWLNYEAVSVTYDKAKSKVSGVGTYVSGDSDRTGHFVSLSMPFDF